MFIMQTSPLPEQTTDSSQVNCDDSAINQLLSDLGGLVGSSLLSDVQIQTGSGSIIPAHAVILVARCHKIREVSLETLLAVLYLHIPLSLSLRSLSSHKLLLSLLISLNLMKTQFWHSYASFTLAPLRQ